jgi:hypothetical protein
MRWNLPPTMWWDLVIGSEACGLGCRSCFLMLTHRIKGDPLRHLQYDNLDDFVPVAERWSTDPHRDTFIQRLMARRLITAERAAIGVSDELFDHP